MFSRPPISSASAELWRRAFRVMGSFGDRTSELLRAACRSLRTSPAPVHDHVVERYERAAPPEVHGVSAVWDSTLKSSRATASRPRLSCPTSSSVREPGRPRLTPRPECRGVPPAAWPQHGPIPSCRQEQLAFRHELIAGGGVHGGEHGRSAAPRPATHGLEHLRGVAVWMADHADPARRVLAAGYGLEVRGGGVLTPRTAPRE
jgi:hypothetical protein